jgi:hypothetical protein
VLEGPQRAVETMVGVPDLRGDEKLVTVDPGPASMAVVTTSVTVASVTL